MFFDSVEPAIPFPHAFWSMSVPSNERADGSVPDAAAVIVNVSKVKVRDASERVVLPLGDNKSLFASARRSPSSSGMFMRL